MHTRVHAQATFPQHPVITITTQLPASFWFGFFPTLGQGWGFSPWEVGGPPIP